MILIADSGATKTDWMAVSKDSYRLIGTEGINPFHQTEEYIRNIINSSLLPNMEREDIAYTISLKFIFTVPDACHNRL